MITEIVAILGLAALCVGYGLMNRGRTRACGSGCSCSLLSGTCDRPDGPAGEAPHDPR